MRTALCCLGWATHLGQVQMIVHRNWLPFEEQAEGCLSCVCALMSAWHKLGSFAKREIQLRKCLLETCSSARLRVILLTDRCGSLQLFGAILSLGSRSPGINWGSQEEQTGKQYSSLVSEFLPQGSCLAFLQWWTVVCVWENVSKPNKAFSPQVAFWSWYLSQQ